jgi:hypothetical protein
MDSRVEELHEALLLAVENRDFVASTSGARFACSRAHVFLRNSSMFSNAWRGKLRARSTLYPMYVHGKFYDDNAKSCFRAISFIKYECSLNSPMTNLLRPWRGEYSPNFQKIVCQL